MFSLALKEMGDHSWNKENDTEKASVYYARAVHNNNHPEVLQVYFKKLDFFFFKK